jgi:hypothetical protein
VKQLVGLVALGAVVVVAVLGLADATQNRADGLKSGTRSEVVLEVETRNVYDPDVAAQGLWGTCQQTVDHKRLRSFEALGDGRFSIVVEPAIGEHDERRLVGCLEDFTIDRVLGDVIEIRDLEREPKPAS